MWIPTLSLVPGALCLRDAGLSRKTVICVVLCGSMEWISLSILVVYCWLVKYWLRPSVRDWSSSKLLSIAVIRFIYPFNQYHNLYLVVTVWGYWGKFWKTIFKDWFQSSSILQGPFLLSILYSFSSQIFKCLFKIKCHGNMSCIWKIINIIDRNVSFLLRCVSPNPTVQSLILIQLLGNLVSLRLPYLG